MERYVARDSGVSVTPQSVVVPLIMLMRRIVIRVDESEMVAAKQALIFTT